MEIKPLSIVERAAEFKFGSKIEPLTQSSGHQLRRCSRRQSKVLSEISMAKRLGQRSSTALAGQMGKHKHNTFTSRLQSMLAATGSLPRRATTLLILTQFESPKGFNFFKILGPALTSYQRRFICLVKMKFSWI